MAKGDLSSKATEKDHYETARKILLEIAPEIESGFEYPNVPEGTYLYDGDADILATVMGEKFKEYLSREALRICIEDGRTKVLSGDFIRAYRQLIPQKK